MKTVTFCGHSDLCGIDITALKQKLYNEIKYLVVQGAREFLLGGYGDFDFLCAQTVKELKTEYMDILSVIVLPYLDKEYDKKLYDCSEYPNIENVPLKFAILKRNQYMVQKSDAVIAYVCHSWGGAAKMLAFANKKGKVIINLA